LNGEPNFVLCNFRITIPKPQNAVTLSAEPGRAFFVVIGLRLLAMLCAINLYNKTSRMRDEVGDVAPKQRLATPVQSTEFSTA